jgi:hypothetical protein
MACPAYDVNAACSGFVYALHAGTARSSPDVPGGWPWWEPMRSPGTSTSPTAPRACSSETVPGAVILEASEEPGVLGSLWVPTVPAATCSRSRRRIGSSDDSRGHGRPPRTTSR